MATFINGLIGGVVATAVMTAFMMGLGDDSPPPTAVFWSQFLGEGDPDQYMMQGMVLHFIYGIIAGGVFVPVAAAIGIRSVTVLSGIFWGLGWGIVLFIIAAVFWMKIVLSMDTEPKQAGMFLFFHLVYGSVLGAWVGFRFF